MQRLNRDTFTSIYTSFREFFEEGAATVYEMQGLELAKNQIGKATMGKKSGKLLNKNQAL